MRRIRINGVVAAGTVACLFASGCGWLPRKTSQPPLLAKPLHGQVSTASPPSYGPYAYPVIAADQCPLTEFGSACTPAGPTLLTATSGPEEVPHIPPPPRPVLDAKAPQRLTAGQEPTALPSQPAPAQQQPPAPVAQPEGMFAHAADYSSLSGQVQKWRSGWRIRYATVDAVDPHGGCVTLVGTDFDKLRDGDFVRVRGRLLSPQSRGGSVIYHVDAIAPQKR